MNLDKLQNCVILRCHLNKLMIFGKIGNIASKRVNIILSFTSIANRRTNINLSFTSIARRSYT